MVYGHNVDAVTVLVDGREFVKAFQSASDSSEFVPDGSTRAQDRGDKLKQRALHLLLRRLRQQQNQDHEEREDADDGYGGALHESREVRNRL